MIIRYRCRSIDWFGFGSFTIFIVSIIIIIITTIIIIIVVIVIIIIEMV